MHRQLHALALGERSRPAHHFAGNVGQVQRRGHQLHPARVGAGKREQVLGQPLHARNLGAHVVEQFAVVLDRLLTVLVEQVGRRAQDRQRRAQLV